MTSPFAPEMLDLADDALLGEFLDAALPPVRRASMLWWLQTADDEVLPQLCQVADPPSPMTAGAASEMAVALCRTASHFGSRAGLLLVWQRCGSEAPRDEDVLWVDAARRACHASGVQLHGVWLRAGRARPLRLDA